jgi:hypothetical protein
VSSVAAPVKPGEVGRFTVKLNPTRAGDWVQHFGLVEEGVAWFADATLGGGPPDDQLAVHLVVTDKGQPGGTSGGTSGGAGPGQGPGAQGPGTDGTGTPSGSADSSDDSSDSGGCTLTRAGGTGGLATLGLTVAAILVARRRRRR